MLLPDLIPAFSNTINSLNMSVGNNIILFSFIRITNHFLSQKYTNYPHANCPRHTLIFQHGHSLQTHTKLLDATKEPLRAKFWTDASRQISADINGTTLSITCSEFCPLPQEPDKCRWKSERNLSCKKYCI